MPEKEELGYLALVLHAHLPYVRHVEEHCLEERWFFEALTETYLPLLQVFETLVKDQVDFRITLSLSPTLLEMLDDDLLLSRYEKHLQQLIELAIKETARTRRDPHINRLAVMYLRTFMMLQADMDRCGYRLIPRFKRLTEQGVLELMTTSATHGFLPGIETEESIYSQWEIGLSTFERHFGFRPKGVWLPECGYTPGIDRILNQFGMEYFFCDAHAFEHAKPKPNRGIYAPLKTGYGVHAFARDRESSAQVWSSIHGYPGDSDYREYYRDIGFDLPLSYIHPYIHPQGIRVNTGIKYFRITNEGDHKEPYDPRRALEKAALHAGNFLFNRLQQIMYQAARMDDKPLIVAPYDAELFGHWWYEGPKFIDFLCRKIHYDQKTFKMITPSEYLIKYPEHDTGQLPFSSWGRNGYGEVWINPRNAWIYRHLHKAEKRMIRLAETFPRPSELETRALNMAAKQLLLAQSSDWPFIMDNQSMVEYALRRIKDHLGAFHKLYEDLHEGSLDEAWLAEWEARYPLFKQLSYRVYLPQHEHRVAIASGLETGARPKRKILMLSWEYPPHVVGGLSRAVYDLSRTLARQGEEVHVLTAHAEDSPEFETMEGVYVHRIPCLMENDRVEFIDWVLQLNLAMIGYVERLRDKGLRFALIHAHDWLVSLAARELKKKLGCPLVATVHATEYGRNQGIFTELQQKIHWEERKLTDEAQKVLVCSQYMAGEVIRLFQLPAEKVQVIPNGVDAKKLDVYDKTAFKRCRYALPEEKIVFFVGRLVPEKGAQYLLEAVPDILSLCPQAKFVISGKGPMGNRLAELAREKGIAQNVLFTGFIDDAERNALLHHADIAVFPSIYEPFGIVALEAMAAGTPVIVSDTGGLSEIVEHGVNGLKVYPGMVTSLRDQLIYALQHEDHLRRMADRASGLAAGVYNWNELARTTRGIYDSLTMQPAISFLSQQT